MQAYAIKHLFLPELREKPRLYFDFAQYKSGRGWIARRTQFAFFISYILTTLAIAITLPTVVRSLATKGMRLSSEDEDVKPESCSKAFVLADLSPVGCATGVACCTGEIREHSVFSVRGIVLSTEESPSFTAGRMSSERSVAQSAPTHGRATTDDLRNCTPAPPSRSPARCQSLPPAAAGRGIQDNGKR